MKDRPDEVRRFVKESKTIYLQKKTPFGHKGKKGAIKANEAKVYLLPSSQRRKRSPDELVSWEEAVVLKLVYFKENGTDSRPIKPPRVSIPLGDARTCGKLIEKKRQRIRDGDWEA